MNTWKKKRLNRKLKILKRSARKKKDSEKIIVIKSQFFVFKQNYIPRETRAEQFAKYGSP